MCGIVGYIGKRKAYPILINGLKRLEYRGYDSSGVALISNTKKLNVYKAKGKVAVLEAETADKDITGTIGIAHTRWATHGVPSVVNAHPHKSQSGNIAVVHNGIIENYAELKADLIEKGFKFVSETDTEVVAQLIEYLKESNNCTLGEAVRVAMRIVIGAYAICVIEQNDPDTIIVARQSSPLVIGIGENNSEFFIASDASPIAEYTTNMVYLNDGEVATDWYGRKVPRFAHGAVALEPTSSSRAITKAILGIYDDNVDRKLLVRRLTVVVGSLVARDSVKQAKEVQLDLFADHEAEERRQKERKAKAERENRMQKAALTIQKRFGKNAILRGTDFEDGATLRDRNSQVGGHKG